MHISPRESKVVDFILKEDRMTVLPLPGREKGGRYNK